MTKHTYISVAIPLPVRDPFIYTMDAADWHEGRIGARVIVPFNRRSLMGYIVGKAHEPSADNRTRIKQITRCLDESPIIIDAVLKTTQWMSTYYMCSWGEALECALPAIVKQRHKTLDAITLRKAKIEKVAAPPRALKEITLSPEQERAHKALESYLDRGIYHKVLVYGVTGSGKTELYIRAIKTALAHNKTAICLVPEIALTAHLKHYYESHFHETLAIMHSRMTNRERFKMWRALYRGEKRVVLGPRSALFAPLRSVGVIILDEEHENTYKQNDTPRYHARDVAAVRAQYEGAVLLLGGATPSLETMYTVDTGTCDMIRLRKRVVDRPLPEVRLIDMKHEVRNNKVMLISQFLHDRIEERLARKEGILLFLNRRGFATHVVCYACGGTLACEVCKVSLTYHQAKNTLLCHYCDQKVPVPDGCPTCGNTKLYFGGAGTERIESYLARLFPTARIKRFDADSVKKRGAHDKILHDFEHKKIDILVGTQMLTKGFDFPHVTLVGVVNADTALSLPDFRSTERTFQLLTQVAGRAGRGAEKGLVVIQTFSPQHYVLQAAREHDFDAFYKQEINRRKPLFYPPFSSLINIIFRAKDERKLIAFGGTLRTALEKALDEEQPDILGPAPLPFYHLHGMFRWHLMIKGKQSSKGHEKIRQVLSKIKRVSGVQMAVDVDPVNIL